MLWVLLAAFIELFAVFFSNRYFRFASFLFYFLTVLLLVIASDFIGLGSIFFNILGFFHDFDVAPEALVNTVSVSSIFYDFFLNKQSTGPNNFLFHFFKYYSAQGCGAFDEFTLITVSGLHEDRIVLLSLNTLGTSLRDFQFAMDPDSNPIFFSVYNLNFFLHDILFFFCSLLILFLGLFFYGAHTNANRLAVVNGSVDFDVLYRLTEVLLISILVIMHFSSAREFIDSISTFGYSFVFNNLLATHPVTYILKDVLVILFLFFNFFFRLRSFIYRENTTTANTPGTNMSPMELPFLLLSILVFCAFLLSANDFNMMLVCLEGITFIIAVVIAFDPNRSAASASIKYFTLGIASSGFFSMAAALTYGLLLTLDFKSITDFFYFTDVITSEFLPLFVFTSVLLTLSFFIKLSVFPGNFWVLDIYNGCNLPIISVLVLLKALYFIIFAKLYFSVYSYCSSFIFPLVVAASLGSMLFSTYGLLTELHLKQFIAYSSTGQFGFLLITLICYQDSVTFLSIFIYLFYYISVMLIFFFSLSHMHNLGSIDKLTDMYDYREATITNFFLVVSLLSLAGLPPFFGFFAKVTIMLNIAASGLSTSCLLLVFLLNIGMSFGYIRALRLMYFNFSGSSEISARLVLDNKEESVAYSNEVGAYLISSSFFIKFSYFFYFGIIHLLVLMQIFGFYFFGYMLHYLDPLTLFFSF